MKSIVLISLVALCSLALQSNAYAENKKTYNGSYCGAYYVSQESDLVHQVSGITNYANAARFISCPVMEDSVLNTDGTLNTGLYYTGVGTFICALNSMNHDGSVRQTQVGSRSNTGWITIPRVTTDDPVRGTYSIYCLLPSNGTLNTIWFGENDSSS
ncbi:MAG: hypothetical protein ACU4EQ_10170 [Candidatus Nitrosoglobus sp.]|jgi:hypothetical protein